MVRALSAIASLVSDTWHDDFETKPLMAIVHREIRWRWRNKNMKKEITASHIWEFGIGIWYKTNGFVVYFVGKSGALAHQEESVFLSILPMAFARHLSLFAVSIFLFQIKCVTSVHRQKSMVERENDISFSYRCLVDNVQLINTTN